VPLEPVRSGGQQQDRNVRQRRRCFRVRSFSRRFVDASTTRSFDVGATRSHARGDRPGRVVDGRRRRSQREAVPGFSDRLPGLVPGLRSTTAAQGCSKLWSRRSPCTVLIISGSVRNDGTFPGEYRIRGASSRVRVTSSIRPYAGGRAGPESGDVLSNVAQSILQGLLRLHASCVHCLSVVYPRTMHSAQADTVWRRATSVGSAPGIVIVAPTYCIIP